MTDVCREFGISRKTGYKIFDRYKEHGLEALNVRSRRPVRYANQLPEQVESLILNLRREQAQRLAIADQRMHEQRRPWWKRSPARSAWRRFAVE